MAQNNDNLNFNIPMDTDNQNQNLHTGQTTEKTNQQDTTKATNNNNNNTNEQVDFTNFLKHASNPCVVLFTILFKSLSITSFLLLNLFINNEALVFILVVILSAFDFWFVKNVSGRILVGLRWWNEVKDDGNEEWIFESDHEVRKTSIDTTVFWTSLYITPIFWGVF